MLNRLARWYFVNYLKPLCDQYLKAELAKVSMRSTRTRHIGEVE